MADITGTVSALKAAADAGKLVLNANAALSIAEFKGEIADMVDKLLEARREIFELDDRLRQVKKELAQVREIGEMTFAHNARWRGDAKEGGDGPYCSRCAEAETKLVRMHDRGSKGYMCPSCEVWVRLPWSPPPQQRRIVRG